MAKSRALGWNAGSFWSWTKEPRARQSSPESCLDTGRPQRFRITQPAPVLFSRPCSRGLGSARSHALRPKDRHCDHAPTLCEFARSKLAPARRVSACLAIGDGGPLNSPKALERPDRSSGRRPGRSHNAIEEDDHSSLADSPHPYTRSELMAPSGRMEGGIRLLTPKLVEMTAEEMNEATDILADLLARRVNRMVPGPRGS